MRRLLAFSFLLFVVAVNCHAQHSDENARLIKLHHYEDTLAVIGKRFINAETDMERKNANYEFIKTLVIALKIPNSFLI